MSKKKTSHAKSAQREAHLAARAEEDRAFSHALKAAGQKNSGDGGKQRSCRENDRKRA